MPSVPANSPEFSYPSFSRGSQNRGPRLTNKHLEFVMTMPFRFSQLDHCSVIITDVERSRRFYRDVLGLKEINKPRTFDFVVLWFDLGNQHVHLLLKDRADTISPR